MDEITKSLIGKISNHFNNKEHKLHKKSKGNFQRLRG